MNVELLTAARVVCDQFDEAIAAVVSGDWTDADEARWRSALGRLKIAVKLSEPPPGYVSEGRLE